MKHVPLHSMMVTDIAAVTGKSPHLDCDRASRIRDYIAAVPERHRADVGKALQVKIGQLSNDAETSKDRLRNRVLELFRQSLATLEALEYDAPAADTTKGGAGDAIARGLNYAERH